MLDLAALGRKEISLKELSAGLSFRSLHILYDEMEESRRIQHTYLSAWPGKPHLDVTYILGHPGARPRNAVKYFVATLGHVHSHIEQIQKILKQSKAALLDAVT